MEGWKNGAHPSNLPSFHPISSWYFDGILDEVAVFNVALSENEIGSVMTNGLEKALGLTAVSPKGKLTTIWGNIKQQ